MIRFAQQADANALHHLLQLAFSKYDTELTDTPALAETPTSLKEKIASSHKALLVLKNGQISAMCLFQFANRRCHFIRLCVHPAYQGQGLGTLLLKEMEQHANAQGCSSMCCQARKANCAYYEKLGYSISGYHAQSDLYLLKKMLKERQTRQCA